MADRLWKGMARRRVLLSRVLAVFALAAPSAFAALDETESLRVRSEPSGGIRATAALMLPAPPEIVQAILTDYRRWPELFDVKMRLANLEWHNGRAITDLYIKHAFLPGERRLLCESQVLPGGGLVTRLLGGDFKRYRRTWKLSPDGESRTHAEFDLLVEIDTLVPDWLVAYALKGELETHFRRVAQRAAELAKRGS
jgi:hypothetical protein